MLLSADLQTKLSQFTFIFPDKGKIRAEILKQSCPSVTVFLFYCFADLCFTPNLPLAHCFLFCPPPFLRPSLSAVHAKSAVVSGSLRNASCQSDRRGVTSVQSRQRGDKPSTLRTGTTLRVWTRAEEKEGEAECVGVRTAVLERMSQCFVFFFKEGTG